VLLSLCFVWGITVSIHDFLVRFPHRYHGMGSIHVIPGWGSPSLSRDGVHPRYHGMNGMVFTLVITG
jgi:hypothetical protein